MSEMKEQPLWLDISEHQGDLDFDKIAALRGDDFVFGIYSRAGYGKDGGYYDKKFQQNWLATAQFDYRMSYWAYWDWFPLMHQLDMWFKANPTLDVGIKNIAMPRVWDLEKEFAHPSWTSDETWKASDIVLSRDGHRFIIYSREDILERTLCKYWSEEQLNEHYYILAQYDLNDPANPPCTEYNGIRVPLNIRPERILKKQTVSCMEIYPGSGFVDRNRWIWTDAETMHDDIQEFWGEPAPPPVDCCDEIPIIQEDIRQLDQAVQSLGEMVQANGMDISILSKDVNILQKNYEMLDKAIGELNDKMDSLPGGHDHPNWMKVLGWVK